MPTIPSSFQPTAHELATMAASGASYGVNEPNRSLEVHPDDHIPGDGCARGTFVYSSFDEGGNPAFSLQPTHTLDGRTSGAEHAYGDRPPLGFDEHWNPGYSLQPMHSLYGRTLGNEYAHGNPLDLSFDANGNPSFSLQPIHSLDGQTTEREHAYGSLLDPYSNENWNLAYSLQPMYDLCGHTQRVEQAYESTIVPTPYHYDFTENGNSADAPQTTFDSDTANHQAVFGPSPASLGEPYVHSGYSLQTYPPTDINRPATSYVRAAATQPVTINSAISVIARGGSANEISWVDQTPIGTSESPETLARSAHSLAKASPVDVDDNKDRESQRPDSQQQEPAVKVPVKDFAEWKVTYDLDLNMSRPPAGCGFKVPISLYITPPNRTYLKGNRRAEYANTHICLEKTQIVDLAGNRNANLQKAMTKELELRYNTANRKTGWQWK